MERFLDRHGGTAKQETPDGGLRLTKSPRHGAKFMIAKKSLHCFSRSENCIQILVI